MICREGAFPQVTMTRSRGRNEMPIGRFWLLKEILDKETTKRYVKLGPCWFSVFIIQSKVIKHYVHKFTVDFV